MIRPPVDMRPCMPIERRKAALIAGTASKYQCTLTLEHDNIVLNLKSMIGLLSQSVPNDGRMDIVADGVDERAATDALSRLLSGEGC